MKRVVFWGSGSRAEEARELLQGWQIEAVVDNNPKLQGQKWHGIPLISFSDFLAMENRPILLVTPHFCSSILQQLREAGVDKWVTYNDILAGNSAEGMKKDQLSFLYEATCLQLGKVKKLQHNYFYECFLRSGSKEGRQNRLLQMCQAAKHPVLHYRSRSAADSVNILFGRQVELVKGRHLPEEADLLFTHSLYEEDYDAKFMELEAMRRGVPVILSDEGFLHSIEPVEQLEKNKFRQGHSLVLDMGGDYINAGSPSRVENILNSDWEMSQEERYRAEGLIKTILEQKLSKYNSQTATDFRLPAVKGGEKVLVVDQLYGDMSISYGQATDEMFSEMLGVALEENPEADIYVKAHPVKGKKHFAGYEDHPRVIWLEATMNPIALLEQVDKVYVCTSQLGFEALMCGKEVHVFGMPFYAGWGVTRDRQSCPRRKKRRSVEEIFYAAYVFSTVYLSYRTGKVCEIEDVIDELLELRRSYVNSMKKKHKAFMVVVNEKLMFALGTFLINLKKMEIDYDTVIVYSDVEIDERLKEKFASYKVRWILYTHDEFCAEFSVGTGSLHFKAVDTRYSFLIYTKFLCLKHLREFSTVILIDLDVLVLDKIDELFALDCNIAWKNGLNFSEKFDLDAFEDKEKIKRDLLEKHNITKDTVTPNGGLIVVNDNFDYMKCYSDGVDFFRKYIINQNRLWGGDEIIFAFFAAKNKLRLHAFDNKVYNVFPYLAFSGSKIIHFMGKKVWSDLLLSHVFPMWMEYYQQCVKEFGLSSKMVRSDRIGMLVEKELIRDMWLGLLARIYKVLPKELKIREFFDKKWLIFDYNEVCYYEFKVNFKGKFMCGMWISGEQQVRKTKQEIEILVNKNYGKLSYFIDHRGLYLYTKEYVEKGKIEEYFLMFYNCTEKIRLMVSE